jgi:very-short-patch-repair endonuclease
VDGLERLLRQQDHVLTTWQALRHLSVKALRHRVESGRWQRPHRGLFVAHNGAVTALQRDWLSVLSVGADRLHDVGLGGLSALRQWGLRGVAATGTHVVTTRRVRSLAGVHVHRLSAAPDLVSPHVRRPAVTLPGVSLIDAAAWARSDNEARMIIATCFQQGIVALADVMRAADARPAARRRALSLRTARDCAGGSHSVGELDFLDLCRRFHLPEPARQVARRDRMGRLRYLDAVFEPWRVVVEIDGAHHLNVAQMWDDAGRANELELDGYVVLRYPAWAVKTRAEQIAAEIRAALRRAGWAG